MAPNITDLIMARALETASARAVSGQEPQRTPLLSADLQAGPYMPAHRSWHAYPLRQRGL